jgi:hypothetical protein
MSNKLELPIPETRLYRRLNISNPKIFEMDFPLFLYNGRIFKLAETPIDENYIKIVDCFRGFEEIGSHKKYEEEYFRDESVIKALNESKKDFVRSLMIGVTKEEERIIFSMKNQILKKIDEYYSTLSTKKKAMPYVGKGLISSRHDSLFSRMNGYERSLMLDEKLYDLLTMQEYLEKFRDIFEPLFFVELREKAGVSSPEELSKYLTNNVNRMNEEALPLVRNKIWHSKKSCKISFDGVYFVEEFRGSAISMLDIYKGLIERKVKTEAINDSEVWR